MAEDPDVQAGVRRIVGRAALRRLSHLAQDMLAEEREKARLVRKIIIGLLLVGIAVFIAVRFVRPF